MHDSVRSLIAILFLVLITLAGCGDDGDPSAPGRDPEGDVLDAMRKSPAQEEAENLHFVKVTLLDKETDQPVSGAGVRLYSTPRAAPSRVQAKELSTNLDGEAIFKVLEAQRLMARSEYSLENTEFPPSAEGETHVTLRVQPHAEVTGRVVGPDGNGVEGASVYITVYGPQQGRDSNTPPLPGAGLDVNEFMRRFGYDLEAEAVTGAEGRFTCRVKTFKTLAAAAYKEGILCPCWTLVELDGNAPRFKPVKIPLVEKARLELTFYDALGRPMANRLLSLVETHLSQAMRSNPRTFEQPFSAFVPTDDSGRAELDVPCGVDIAVERCFLFPDPGPDGKLPDPVRTEPIDALTPAPGQTLKIAVTPPRTVRLHGAIRDSEGNPLAGADLLLPVNSLKVDGKGMFSLVVPYNVHRRLAYTAWMEGYQPAGGLLPEVGEDTMELELVVNLEKALDLTLTADSDVDRIWLFPATLPGRIEAPDDVEAELLPDPVGLARGYKTGERAYTFLGLVPGIYAAVAQKGAFHFASIKGMNVQETMTRTVRLDPAMLGQTASIQGRVVCPEGMKPQGIQVILMRNELKGVRRWDPMSLGTTGFGWAVTLTAPDGRFAFNDLAPGRYMMAAAIVEWNQRMDVYLEQTIVPGENSVTMKTTENRGGLDIQVMNSEGDSLPGVSLRLLDPVDSPLGLASGPLTYTNGEGRIVLEKLPPGRYGFSISLSGGEDYMLNGRVLVKEGAISRFTVVLNREL